MAQATFTNWTEIRKAHKNDGGVTAVLAEKEIMANVDTDKLSEILEQDGGLHTIERVDFTPGGDFVMALTNTGQVIGTAVELVS